MHLQRLGSASGSWGDDSNNRKLDTSGEVEFTSPDRSDDGRTLVQHTAIGAGALSPNLLKFAPYALIGLGALLFVAGE